MQCDIVQGTTKSGKKYQALKIVIGEYETFIFPTKIELMYIRHYLKESEQKNKEER